MLNLALFPVRLLNFIVAFSLLLFGSLPNNSYKNITFTMLDYL